jgi:3',5'-cyclic AMP phosphodiesterase CpdA
MLRPGGSVTDYIPRPDETHGNAQDDAFALAHLSDVHLGPLPPIPFRLLNAKRAAGAINWYRKRRFIHAPEIADAIARATVASMPDHIAVSGDLTNLGLASEIARGSVWLGRMGRAGHVSIVPGNHDIYSTVHGQRLGPDAVAAWAPHFAPCEIGKGYGGAAPFPFVRILTKGSVRLALIGPDQLAALARILDATRRDGFIRVVMLHHPPLPGLSTARHDLTDAAALAALLQHHGAELVMHGHNHRRMINRCTGPDGDIPIVGVPSASAVRTKRDEPLARTHTYLFRAGASPQRPRITLIARGLATAAGGITELERVELQ